MQFLEYKEKVKHGTGDFPLGYYYVSETYFRYNMPLHCHPEFEIVRVVSGELCLNINGVQYNLKSGDFAFVECQALHSGVPKNCVYECVVFDLNMLRSKNTAISDKYITPIIKGSNSIIYKVVDNKASIYPILEKLFSTVKKAEEFYELNVISILYELFYNLYSLPFVTRGIRTSKNERQIKTMWELLEWISLHYSEQITLNDLSKVSGFSEKYLCRIFKDYTFKTPIDYINQLRIENACQDILYSGCTVTEAALNNGYNNTSYFCRVFKQNTGFTPREYKRKYTYT